MKMRKEGTLLLCVVEFGLILLQGAVTDATISQRPTDGSMTKSMLEKRFILPSKVWSSWGHWQCKIMNNGACQKTRYRTCITGNLTDCPGKNYNISTCDKGDCPGTQAPISVTPPVQTNLCRDLSPQSCKLLGLQNNNFCLSQSAKNYFCREFCGTCVNTAQLTSAPTVNSSAVNPCSQNPCVHGACAASGQTYTCSCNSGYSGPTCADIDECQSRPCVHGFCVNEINGYRCNCFHGYTGRQCSTDIDECQSRPCVNGFCHNEINGYTCRCFNGYTGKQCSTGIDNCAPKNPCHHHGTCHDQVNGFSCTCAAGYSGTTCNQKAKVRDCKNVLDFGLGKHDGIQNIDLGSSQKSVYCDMTTAGGGWTVVLYRKDSRVDFLHRDLNDYALGFGSKHTDFWQGLEDMHALTSDGRRYQLRVDMTAANGTNYYEIYDDFYIGPARDFTLHIGSHRGTAGDSLSGHNGFGFTTSDHDVDSSPGANCAKYLGGSWWFHDCYDSCLTCEYVIATPGTQECASMSWNAVNYCEPLRMAKMMIRPM